MGVWDELVAGSVTDETDRASLKGILGKYPKFNDEVEKGFLRQQDYSRNMDGAAKEKTELQQKITTLEGRVGKWDSWAQSEWDFKTNRTKTEEKVLSDLQAARERLTELEARGETEMDWDEINTKLASDGYVKADALKGFAKVEDLDKAGQRTAASMEHVYTYATPKYFAFQAEFGRPMTGEESSKFLQHLGANPEEYLKDSAAVDKGYDTFVAAQRANTQVEARKKELAELDKQLEERRAQQQTASPTDNGEQPGTAMGHFQRNALGIKGEEDEAIERAELGKGELARIGIEKLRKGELVGSTP